MYASAVSELWLLPSPRSTCLFQETFLLKPWTLRSIAFYLHSQRTESAVSSLIHVIQLFHKPTVTVTSPSFIHSCNWNLETTHGVFLCAATADLNHAWTVVVFFIKKYECDTFYIILLLMISLSRQETLSLEHARLRRPQQCAAVPLREQHFQKVYLGCHIQGQGLLTDMISLAGGKGTHYPQTVWSRLYSFQTHSFTSSLEQPTMVRSKAILLLLTHK